MSTAILNTSAAVRPSPAFLSLDASLFAAAPDSPVAPSSFNTSAGFASFWSTASAAQNPMPSFASERWQEASNKSFNHAQSLLGGAQDWKVPERDRAQETLNTTEPARDHVQEKLSTTEPDRERWAEDEASPPLDSTEQIPQEESVRPDPQPAESADERGRSGPANETDAPSDSKGEGEKEPVTDERDAETQPSRENGENGEPHQRDSGAAAGAARNQERANHREQASPIATRDAAPIPTRRPETKSGDDQRRESPEQHNSRSTPAKDSNASVPRVNTQPAATQSTPEPGRTNEPVAKLAPDIATTSTASTARGGETAPLFVNLNMSADASATRSQTTSPSTVFTSFTSAHSSTASTESSPAVRGAMSLVNTNGGSMTMKLEPASLGSLRIQMTVTGDRISVQFHTQTSEAGSMIRESMQSLRQSLESQGLKLDNVTIQPLTRAHAGQSGQGSSSDSGDRQQGQQSFQHDAGDGRSRGHQEQHSESRHFDRERANSRRANSDAATPPSFSDQFDEQETAAHVN